MCVAQHASALVVCGKRRTRKTIVLSARQTDRQKFINALDDYAMLRATQCDLDGTEQIIPFSVSASTTMQSHIRIISDQLTDRVQRENSCCTLDL